MFDTLLDPLLGSDVDAVEAGMQLRKLASHPELSGADLLTELAGRTDAVAESDPAILAALLRLIHQRIVTGGVESLSSVDPTAVADVHAALPPPTLNRHLLMQLLATQGTTRSLTTLLDGLESRPPRNWIEAGQILGVLMRGDAWDVDTVFPRALDGLSTPALAAPVLDLANHLTRQGQVGQHPAAPRVAVLNHLLGEVAQRLARFEQDPREFGDDVQTVQDRLGEAVALSVSLCDALGLIGDDSSLGKLMHAVELRHRRVQCEAAGALARMGEDLGRKRLIELSADPAARLRAIQYADELGFGEAIDDQFRSEAAIAESELALWLTQPQQMGVPPTSIEVIESRRLMWPSFTEPVDVHLIRFEYHFGQQSYSNVGIAGPVSFALSADVADLPIDDILAIYAGWHAEHDDIFTVPATDLNDAQRRVMEPLQTHLARQGYATIRGELLGFFLDEQAGVFTAERDHTPCVVVTDGLETIEQPTAGRLRPLGPEDLFHLYKGRKMLRTFNP